MSNDLNSRPVAVIGYSGHGYVAIDILKSAARSVTHYCDREEKKYNPYSLQYLGQETDPISIQWFMDNEYFIAIGDNKIREKIYHNLIATQHHAVNAIHPGAVISPTVKLEDAIMIAAGAVINPLSHINKGAICNTRSSIDHECTVGAFAHIGPGAVLCGNVTVGARTFIGAGAVIRQGIIIGNDVMIGAGCVVVKDVPDNVIMVGNPQREIFKK